MSGAQSGKRNGPATLADLEDVPENQVGELLEGRLYVQPRPALLHASVTSTLGVLLGGPFGLGRGGPGGWIILDEPELLLGDDLLVPDLAGWRTERLPRVPDVARMTLAPDWVCEALSPGTAAIDRGIKLPIYARAEVRHVWLIDPRARTLEVLRRTVDGQWLTCATHRGGRVEAEPFDAVPLDLDLLWSPGSDEPAP